MAKLQDMYQTLSGYLQPGEELLVVASAEEATHDLARVALAGLAPSTASRFMVGLSSGRLMLLLDNLGTKLVKAKSTDNIPLQEIVQLDFTPKRHTVKASLLLRNGKKRSFRFQNHPADNVAAAQEMMQTLQGLLQGGAAAPRPQQQAAPAAPPPPYRPAQPQPRPSQPRPAQPRPAPQAPPPPAQPAQPRPNPRASQGACACRACGHQAGPEDKFCEMCGVAIQQAGPKFCPQCGREARPGAKFCGGCGAAMQR